MLNLAEYPWGRGTDIKKNRLSGKKSHPFLYKTAGFTQIYPGDLSDHWLCLYPALFLAFPPGKRVDHGTGQETDRYSAQTNRTHKGMGL